MSFEPWRERSYLVRFEHIMEKNEDPNYSRPITFNLNDVFGNIFDIESFRETNLAANQWIEDKNRFVFEREIKTNEIRRSIREVEQKGGIEVLGESQSEEDSRLTTDDSKKFDITLNPMQMKTFIVTMNEAIV